MTKKENINQVNFLDFPIYVWWDITNRCNLNCLHCYSRSGESYYSSDELNTIEIKNLISDLSANRIFYIYFLGGEPFIRPDFMDILRFARYLEIRIMISNRK